LPCMTGGHGYAKEVTSRLWYELEKRGDKRGPKRFLDPTEDLQTGPA